MSRYFFHVLNGKTSIDDEGVEFANLDAARKAAITTSGAMLAQGNQTWAGKAWRMIVADEAGTIVYGVDVSIDRHGL